VNNPKRLLLRHFFARHWKSFLLEIAIAFLVIVLAFAATLWIAIEIEQGVEPGDPQRYTVHFDGIDYQDLTRDYHGLSRSRAEYKTKAGKRIEFHGSFYEVEQ
jgi:hypothetical protein